DNDGASDFGDGLEVFVKSVLRRLVVIRTDRQHTIGAETLRSFRSLYRFRRGIASGAKDDLYLAFCFLEDNAQYSIRFFRFQGGAFACGAAGHDHVDAAADLDLDQTPQRWFVNRSVAEKWRHQCRAAALKLLFRHEPTPIIPRLPL